MERQRLGLQRDIFHPALGTGVAAAGALIALLVLIIGYLLVNPISLP